MHVPFLSGLVFLTAAIKMPRGQPNKKPNLVNTFLAFLWFVEQVGTIRFNKYMQTNRVLLSTKKSLCRSGNFKYIPKRCHLNCCYSNHYCSFDYIQIIRIFEILVSIHGEQSHPEKLKLTVHFVFVY